MTSDKVWYYAQGDQEHGPVTEDEVRQLLQSGTLNGANLAWRDGMEDWAPLAQVTEFAIAATPPPPPVESTPTQSVPPLQPESPRIRARTERRGRGPLASASREFLDSLKLLGQPLLFFGLAIVLLSRGCDSLGGRYADRLKAKHSLAQSSFLDDWDEQRLQINRKLDALGNDDTSDDRRDELQTELEKLNESMTQKQRELENGSWRRFKASARDAVATNQMWGYWRGLFFVLGALLFTVGLTAVGLTSSGPERWICLVMLSIVIFSLFVFGSAWQ